MIKTKTISIDDAHKLAVDVGKRIIDKGETNSKKITINEVKDIFKHSIPDEFRPTITKSQKKYQKYCEKFGMSPEQAKSVQEMRDGFTLLKPNIKELFIYVPERMFNQPSDILGGLIGHELFHTLSLGKTDIGKKNLKTSRKLLKNGLSYKSGDNQSELMLNMQNLLIKPFTLEVYPKLEGILANKEGRVLNKNRFLACIRTTLRTVFDPRLKQGEQKSISELHLPIEKIINPNSIKARPTNDQIDILRSNLTEDSRAFSVSSELYAYGKKKPDPCFHLISQIFGEASNLLEGEKRILAKNA